MNLRDAIFYHIYPLGALGVLDGPRSFGSGSPDAVPLERLRDWIPAMERVGANALYLGPVFESERHGYDTVDHGRVDARLGSNADLAAFSRTLREQGISLVLDAVFNHVGRSHPLVRDVAENGPASPHASWIADYDPNGSRGGLPFGYRGWAGNDDLVQLDTGHAPVREFLIGIALDWIGAYGIAGLRLDAADCLDRGFLRELGRRCRERVPDFFLIGEALDGITYASLLADGLDSATDFEACKALWSSYNDRNFHEIAWTLERLFGEQGLCRDAPLYSFADNHDVDRVASLVRDPAGLYPLYGLLFAMPGVPSVYYGSEWGTVGRKVAGDDRPLRPALDPGREAEHAPQPDLAMAISRFAKARRASRAVREGDCRLLKVESEGISLLRRAGSDLALVSVNASPRAMATALPTEGISGRVLVDLLDPGYRLRVPSSGSVAVDVPPHWLRWLVPAT